MKRKGLITTVVIFFLLVNTTYYWEGKLGLFAMPVFLILTVVYFGLVIALIRQLYLSIKERFSNKFRLLNIGFLTAILTLTFFKPFGFIDFDKFEGENLLIARREGAANCMTTFKLKDDLTFKERNVCFGVTEIKGTYRIYNDTIYFFNVRRAKKEDIKYEFGVIEKLELYTENPHALKLYKSKNDTIGFKYFITKNDLKVEPVNKPNR